MRHQNPLKSARYRRPGQILALALVLCMGCMGSATASQSSSPNYQVDQTQFGSGSSLNDCSSDYCAKTAVGDAVVGGASSANFAATFGSNTTDEPLLEVIVGGGNQDMGTLDITHTGTATSLIRVRSYFSNGYVMQITGTPPSQGVHALTALSTPTTSHQGAEQFGINLANNTSPDIGSGPTQVLAGQSVGQVASDYSGADLFKYVDGDVVASSDTSSSETDYTMSMIINVSNVTPGGRYNGVFSAVVVPLY